LQFALKMMQNVVIFALPPDFRLGHQIPSSTGVAGEREPQSLSEARFADYFFSPASVGFVDDSI
jgi:hypothetical protein